MTSDDAMEPLPARLRVLGCGDDPVPPQVLRAALEALTHREPGSKVAALSRDSLDDPPTDPPTGATGRRLLFRTTSQAVAVEVTRNHGRCGLVGRLEPPGADHVVINHVEGRTVAVVDTAGRFAASDLPTGPVSLRCRAGGVTVDTEWSSI